MPLVPKKSTCVCLAMTSVLYLDHLHKLAFLTICWHNPPSYSNCNGHPRGKDILPRCFKLNQNMTAQSGLCTVRTGTTTYYLGISCWQCAFSWSRYEVAMSRTNYYTWHIPSLHNGSYQPHVHEPYHTLRNQTTMNLLTKCIQLKYMSVLSYIKALTVLMNNDKAEFSFTKPAYWMNVRKNSVSPTWHITLLQKTLSLLRHSTYWYKHAWWHPVCYSYQQKHTW
jgi:hypothetical protein